MISRYFIDNVKCILDKNRLDAQEGSSEDRFESGRLQGFDEMLSIFESEMKKFHPHIQPEKSPLISSNETGFFRKLLTTIGVLEATNSQSQQEPKDTTDYKGFIIPLIVKIKDRAYEARMQYHKNEHDEYISGLSFSYFEVLSSIKNRAQSYLIDESEIGLDKFDPERDLLGLHERELPNEDFEEL